MNHSLILSAVSVHSRHFRNSLICGLSTKGIINSTNNVNNFSSRRFLGYLLSAPVKNNVTRFNFKNYSSTMSVTNSANIVNNTNISQPEISTPQKSQEDVSRFSSVSGEDHLQRTADKHRESQIHQLKVVKVCNISPTVKKLVLNTEIRPVPFSFKAGQWLDVFIPGIDTVGGFSICSSPIHLNTTGELVLCIKKSNHPPSKWIHSHCEEGSKISVRIGGEFFLDTNDATNAGKSILLIAGGVGINPLASIIKQLQDYKRTIGVYGSGTLLMYSAKTHSELLFRESFDKSCEEDPTFSVQYHVTNESAENTYIADNVKYERISKSDIARSLASRLHLCVGFEDINPNVVVYICGPPPMIQDTKEMLTSLGITNIKYEKWW